MDLDKDGHGDLLSGGYKGGQLFVFRGLRDEKFAKREALKGADGKDLTTGSASTVHAVDWDGDGDLDLMAGNIKGSVFYFGNEGSDAKPKYAGKVPIQAGGKPLVVRGDSGPVTVDWDGDGTLDLLVGSGDGAVVFCRGVPGKMPCKLDAPVTLIEKPAGPWASGFGVRTKLCPVDWNGDGTLDLLVGTYGREAPPSKDLSEKQKTRLAEIEKEMQELRAIYKETFEELRAMASKNPDRKRGDKLSQEEMKELRKICDGESDLAVRSREASGKLHALDKETTSLKGRTRLTGRVWFFPRK